MQGNLGGFLPRFSRRKALRLIGGTLAGLPFAGGIARAKDLSNPNILFIMTDDQRKDAMSAYGNTILKTPNMDRIASEGIRFEEMFVTSSLCAPSRASYLTGLYSHGPGIREDQHTFPQRLQEAGYHTGLVGKWHLKSMPTGFDEWVIFPWQGEYYDPELISKGTHLRARGRADRSSGIRPSNFSAVSLRSIPHNWGSPPQNRVPYHAPFVEAFRQRRKQRPLPGRASVTVLAPCSSSSFALRSSDCHRTGDAGGESSPSGRFAGPGQFPSEFGAPSRNRSST